MDAPIEVRVEDGGGDERWVPAEVLSWTLGPGGWWANVRYLEGQLGTFSEAEVRES